MTLQYKQIEMAARLGSKKNNYYLQKKTQEALSHTLQLSLRIKVFDTNL